MARSPDKSRFAPESSRVLVTWPDFDPDEASTRTCQPGSARAQALRRRRARHALVGDIRVSPHRSSLIERLCRQECLVGTMLALPGAALAELVAEPPAIAPGMGCRGIAVDFTDALRDTLRAPAAAPATTRSSSSRIRTAHRSAARRSGTWACRRWPRTASSRSSPPASSSAARPSGPTHEPRPQPRDRPGHVGRRPCRRVR